MARTHIAGFPRIGARRELKLALEAFWRGETSEHELQSVGSTLRHARWQAQLDAGIDYLAAGEFSMYDHVLDHAVLFGALPRRFGFDARTLTLTQYFELARGNASQPAMEMTKWFDTNYHYLVPELDAQTSFQNGCDIYLREVAEALALGAPVKPVLIGPVTFLWLSKAADECDRLALLPALLAAYERVLAGLRTLGVEWVQLDEAALCTELEEPWLSAYETAYARLSRCGAKLLLATYFGPLTDYAQRIAQLPVHGFHIDLVRAPEQSEFWCARLPQAAVLSAGIIDGRNVWRTDLRRALELLTPLHEALGGRLWIAPSCSLIHVPVSVEQERRVDPEILPWLAFAREKLDELRTLARALNEGCAAVSDAFDRSDTIQASRKASLRATNEVVRERVRTLTDSQTERRSPYSQRISKQRAALELPALPTTTIGSFPQTSGIRATRAQYRRREITALAYLQRLRSEIAEAVRRQEALGLDVLVHGEAERNDMVEYFAEQLWGCVVTENGWVQSYGSRCVKPPIIYGDVYRPEPMTVDTIAYAQSLTTKPIKGMLTGPVTLLQWSFVRDDRPRSETALQLALAVRDEVEDLEKAGIRVIQIDEPALREGLPLKRRDWKAYFAWAVRAFRTCAASVEDETQIHTHMCYSDFNDILPAIAELDADVVTIEASRSNMALLDAFGVFDYPNDIGPGVYDIHAPRVPSCDEILRLLKRAATAIPVERLWVNPDCGLKTRGWKETELALSNMVRAAKLLRAELGLETAAVA
jgi:5-methyltetrahydropteroyltriglutamate--homocysteine methyltransferase